MARSTAALAALNPRTGEPPARFALELRPEQSPKRVREEIKAALAEFDPSLMPISPVDHGVLILELPGRTLYGVEPARAYAAGYALAEDFGLRTAEPDLPTPFFPEEEPPPPGAPEEEAFRFPPGCWVDAEDGLAARWALEQIRVPQAWKFSEDEGRPAYGRGTSSPNTAAS